MQFETLPGFREFYPESCAERNHVFGVWRRVARSFNFLEYDAPVLEPLELYIEKSGEEIVGQLFNFEDRGGRAVALRPEMTPSLARLVGAKANSLKRPVKWFNIGEHYRYERPQKGRLRAFYQFNVDLLGEQGPSADAELILLLIQTLRAFGLSSEDFKVRLSDRDLWLMTLAGEGLDELSSRAVLGVIDKFERTSREKTVARLAEIIGDEADALLERIEFMLCIRDLDTLRAHVSSLGLEGGLQEDASKRFAEWEYLLKLLSNGGAAEFIQIDFGIVRGLAYYTGFVFEAFEASGEGRALAGGGRYDELVKKLGGPEMPAVGFAMGDVTLMDLLDAKGLRPKYFNSPDIYIVIGGAGERDAAMADASALRSMNVRIEYPLKEQGFGKQFKDANQKGARFALIYGSEELAQGLVKIQDLGQKTEATFPRSELESRVAEVLRSGLSD
ncbi:MAG: histidine--tRNA ligase [Verrucomicrobiota bacterium]